MAETTTADGPVSFLHRKLTPRWFEEHSAILTMPTYDFELSTQTGAAYRRDGSLIVESLRPARLGHWRHVDPVSIAVRDYADIPTIDTAIFGGHFFNMWGHFLFETVPTALLADQLPSWPVIFSPFAPDAPERFSSVWENFKPILAAAGWGDRPLALQQSAIKVNFLIVPERTSVFGLPNGVTSVCPDVSTVYRRIQNSLGQTESAKSPIVARRPDWSARRHPVEGELYDILQSRGCRIFDVAAMTAVEQARSFPSATALIGFSGSNMHNSVFCPEGIPIIEIGDQRSYKARAGDRINPTQSAMTQLMKQHQMFVDAFDETDDGLTPFSAEKIADLVMGIVEQST